ncbi:Feruloyl CoA ortho-hydroxylase 1 [Striga hermonthica]|uniref:feruloyl-CoA 6-hydroxylase n=1 Tax=Striga hermonthica TaxID=68872 RepID=A0A9N7R8N6_STRHE|nr:Feruloyl CoA ortho-hydroxylase 1 [Striga hermonthica]
MSQPENLIEFMLTQGNGVKGLSQLKLAELPQKFVQPPSERLDGIKVAEGKSIPVIDVSDWENPSVAHSICEAATKWGFFQIFNHGIPVEVLDDVIQCAHDFFELPVDERMKYLPENSPTETVTLKSSFSARVDDYMDWKDHLVHLVDHRVEKEFEFWPAVTRDRMSCYVSWARLIIKKLLQTLMKGIKVEEIDEDKQRSLMGVLAASLVYYPECPRPDLAVGSDRHADLSSITLLLQDDVGGLYARANTDQEEWVFVAPTKGALIVNVGDTLQILSNGKYQSIEHRVFLTGSTNRVSVPIFANALTNSIIGPLPEALGHCEKPKYKHVVFGDYFKHFLSKGQDGKKTINFAAI